MPQVGGFKLPFIVVGSAIFLVGFASAFVLPPQNGTFLARPVNYDEHVQSLQQVAAAIAGGCSNSCTVYIRRVT